MLTTNPGMTRIFDHESRDDGANFWTLLKACPDVGRIRAILLIRGQRQGRALNLMIWCNLGVKGMIRRHGSFRKKFYMSIRKTHTKTFGIRDSGFGIRGRIKRDSHVLTYSGSLVLTFGMERAR